MDTPCKSIPSTLGIVGCSERSIFVSRSVLTTSAPNMEWEPIPEARQSWRWVSLGEVSQVLELTDVTT